MKDYAAADPSDYHRFLWSHHLAYALTYDVPNRFGDENMKESRKLFFADVKVHLRALGITTPTEVRSVFEVGCSLGYQLRYLETDLFPRAKDVAGIDIDGQAIAQGTEYLQRVGSRVVLRCADMADLPAVLAGKTYDLIVCTGVLMYLNEGEALAVVRAMLEHCGILLALSGPAHAGQDNCTLEHSTRREGDGSFVHNFDAMVKAAGGQVLARRWEGARNVDGHTIYFVFAGRGPDRQAPGT